jgi:hypothetical protein
MPLNEVPYTGPDGSARAPSEQRRINEVLALAFRGESGKAALDYLRSISIERVCGPGATDQELRHLEGMRFVVGIISQRIAQHHKEQTHVPDRADPGIPGDAFRNPRPKRRVVRTQDS